MKKILFLFIIIILLVPKQSKAQDEASIGASAVLGGLTARENIKEQAELKATEWILTNKPDLKNFYVSTLDFNNTKSRDMSSSSVITFLLQEFTINRDAYTSKGTLIRGAKKYNGGDKYVLYAFTSKGWVNQYGVDYSKIRWYFYNPNEWLDLITEYVKVASSIEDDAFINKSLRNGKLVSSGIKVNRKLEIRFDFLNRDMYLVSDYSEKIKLIYNERSLGIFLKETRDLVQLKRSALEDTHAFLFDNDFLNQIKIVN
tara:strand:- start:117 stop:890 length:774 start_codon:yes stop_codon:yes gene_type:complete